VIANHGTVDQHIQAQPLLVTSILEKSRDRILSLKPRKSSDGWWAFNPEALTNGKRIGEVMGGTGDEDAE